MTRPVVRSQMRVDRFEQSCHACPDAIPAGQPRLVVVVARVGRTPERFVVCVPCTRRLRRENGAQGVAG